MFQTHQKRIDFNTFVSCRKYGITEVDGALIDRACQGVGQSACRDPVATFAIDNLEGHRCGTLPRLPISAYCPVAPALVLPCHRASRFEATSIRKPSGSRKNVA